MAPIESDRLQNPPIKYKDMRDPVVFIFSGPSVEITTETYSDVENDVVADTVAAIMERYDEDLFENPFFICMRENFSTIFESATCKRWIICVPRYSSVENKTIDEYDVSEHILVAVESDEKENLHKTLLNKEVTVENGNITLGKGFAKQINVSILFDETFYNNDDESYKVYCIDHMLGDIPAEKTEREAPRAPKSYEDCKEILWGNAGGRKTRNNLDKFLSAASSAFDRLESEDLRNIVDAAIALFTKSMQIILKDPAVKRSAKFNTMYMDNLKISVETYVCNAIHKRLFTTLTSCMAREEAGLNKITRNLVDLQLADMGIKPAFGQNIPLAKKELSKLNHFSTPLGRLFCLKRVVGALTRPLKQTSDISEATEKSEMMTTDDFLPILIFLIIKSQIANWMTNLAYMKHFHFTKSSDDDEYGFYLASIEAALEHIKSGELFKEKNRLQVPMETGEYSEMEMQKVRHLAAPNGGPSSPGASVFVDNFFEFVRKGDELAVRSLLQKRLKNSEVLYLKLCHPLCSCDNCEKIVADSRNDSSLVTAYTRDDKGYTALHIAVEFGQAHLVDVLVKNGALVDATDYLCLTPLHIACQRGYQNIVLLLLHFHANINAADNDGNTPLHFCAANGHEDCVKGLVFTDAPEHKIEINCKNDIGNTPLHQAAKWGYEGIVKILLENGANPDIRNRKKQTAISLAHNIKVLKLLQKTAFTYVTVNSLNKDEIIEDSIKYVAASRKLSAREMYSKPRSSSVKVPAKASLDNFEDQRREKLFNALSQGDIQMVKYLMGWTDVMSETENSDSESDDDGSEEGEENDPDVFVTQVPCHPLCQCSKCIPGKKKNVTAKKKKPLNIDINTQNSSGLTPLHLAVLYMHLDIVKLLISKRANINVQTFKGVTPLHLATYLKIPDIVEYLLENGSKINIRDGHGDTPLHLSCSKSSKEIVCQLLQYKARVNRQNFKGNTPLHEAVMVGNPSIVNLLVQSGSDPSIVNKQNLQAKHLAKDPAIQKILLSAEKVTVKATTKSRSSSQLSQSSIESDIIYPRLSESREEQSDATSQITVRELFSAFEEEDLKALQILNDSIRHLDQGHTLKRSQTKDMSSPFLDFSLKHSLSIKHFKQDSLKHVTTADKSEPLYAYKQLSLDDADYSPIDSYASSGTVNDISSFSPEELYDLKLEDEKC